MNQTPVSGQLFKAATVHLPAESMVDPVLPSVSTLMGVLPSVGSAIRLLVSAIAVGMGAVWLILNIYQLSPLVRAALLRLLQRRRGPDDRPGPTGHPPPDIDILLPAYQEANVIEHAIRAITDAAYPEDRLHLHILTEPEDERTRTRLWTLVDRYDIRVHRVPGDYPGPPTKPRALDYGFSITDSPIVGVVDAEDLVAPGLFREVVTAIQEAGADYVLGHLDMANEGDGWLNLLFRAEYGFWYGLVVPAFTAVGFPIPLGGTTCFFRRSTLEAVAQTRLDRYGSPWGPSDHQWLRARGLPTVVPWAPNNLTEDFELGLFLWQEGYRFAYLDAITREESPIGLQAWLTQRIRWKKGKLWTFRQYLRAPPRGLRRQFHIYWQSLLPHLGPINLSGLILLFWLATLVGRSPAAPAQALLLVSLVFAGFMVGLYVVGYWTVSQCRWSLRLRRAAVVGLSVPFYWLLQWIADGRAIADIARGRLGWQPTRHLGRHIDTLHIGAANANETPPSRAPLDRRTIGAAIGGILLIGAGLRLAILDRWSLWEDEFFTLLSRGPAPLPDLLVAAGDPHPPLYFLLVRVTLGVFGPDPTPLRLLSVVLSLGTIVVVFQFGRSVFDARTGLVAALLIAVSTVHIHFGRTIRMYSLFTFVAGLSWYGYVALRTDEQCFDWLPQPGRTPTILYTLSTLAMLYTHVFGLFVLVSQHAYRWITTTGLVPRDRWYRLQAVIFAGFVPWLVVLLIQLRETIMGSNGVAIRWIPSPSYGLFRETLLFHAGYPNVYPVLATSETTLVAVIAISFVFNVALVFSVLTYDIGDGPTYYFVGGRQAGMFAIFLLSVVCVPFILSFMLPIFVPRYTLAAGIPLVILVARGLVNVPERHWRLALLGVLLVGSAVTTAAYATSPSQEDWRGVAAHVQAESAPGDLLVVQPPRIEDNLDFYGRALPADRYALPEPASIDPEHLDRLHAAAIRHRTVWLVTYNVVPPSSVNRRLTRTHVLKSTLHEGAVTVFRYERRGKFPDKIQI